MNRKPVILLLGATGQLGSLIAEQLAKVNSITLRVTSRNKSQLEDLSKKYGKAHFLDLDDPKTYQEPFEGVDRLFLLTGYSVSMVVQSKILVDFARKANLKQIVHLGVFSLDRDCTVPHFAWHQMIEAYIKESGIKWTNLHPNCFLQNLINFSLVKEGKLHWYAKDCPCGWIALEDVAEAAAKILADGPDVHHGKDYWFSTESMNITTLAALLSQVTERKFISVPKSPDQFLVDSCVDKKTADPYLASVAESFQQIEDGRMSYIGKVLDDLPKIIGRKGMSVRDWIELHKSDFIQLAHESSKDILWGRK